MLFAWSCIGIDVQVEVPNASLRPNVFMVVEAWSIGLQLQSAWMHMAARRGSLRLHPLFCLFMLHAFQSIERRELLQREVAAIELTGRCY